MGELFDAVDKAYLQMKDMCQKYEFSGEDWLLISQDQHLKNIRDIESQLTGSTSMEQANKMLATWLSEYEKLFKRMVSLRKQKELADML